MSKEADQAQSEAVDQARAGYILFGEHYNFPDRSRIRAADRMGKRYPMIGTEGFEAVKGTGKYPGMLDDLVITLWLQTIKNSSDLTADEIKAGAWSVERAWLAPKEALAEAYKWADGNKISLNDGNAYFEALAVYCKIIDAGNAVAYRVDVEPKAPDGQPNAFV